jgi:hypothetical protein
MRAKLIFPVFWLICHHLWGQSVQIRTVNADHYPKIEIEVSDRNPEQWDKSKIRLLEDNRPIDSLLLESSVPEKKTYKQVFVLFENSHFPSFDAQRIYLKAFLKEALEYFDDRDEIYFAEFDWTLPDGKVLGQGSVYKGDKGGVSEILDAVKRPASSGKTHESTELNSALMEALEFMANVAERPEFEKAVLIFSSEFSNIYNSIHTPESIILSSRQKNIPIYSVRYPRMAPKYSLAKITQATYGKHFAVDLGKSRDDQTARFGKVIEEMNSRAVGRSYLISYTTALPPGTKPVSVKIVLPDDPFQPESILVTPGYGQYIMGNPLLLGLSIGGFTVLLLLVVFLLIRQRKKRMLDRAASDQKLRELREESRREIGKQEKLFEKLENERKSQREREYVLQREQEKEKALELSLARLRQMPRVPFLTAQDGSKYSLSLINLVGRSHQEGCSIVISDATISRKHACILFEKQSMDGVPEANYSFFLVDLGSSNGSYVNEKQVQTPVLLNNGDLIRFGNVSLTYRM